MCLGMSRNNSATSACQRSLYTWKRTNIISSSRNRESIPSLCLSRDLAAPVVELVLSTRLDPNRTVCLVRTNHASQYQSGPSYGVGRGVGGRICCGERASLAVVCCGSVTHQVPFVVGKERF